MSILVAVSLEELDEDLLSRAKDIFHAKIQEYNEVQMPLGRPARYVQVDDSHVMIIYWKHGWKHNVVNVEQPNTKSPQQIDMERATKEYKTTIGG